MIYIESIRYEFSFTPGTLPFLFMNNFSWNRIQGFVIFVKNGKVGDKVKVKVTSVGNRFAIAEIV